MAKHAAEKENHTFVVSIGDAHLIHIKDVIKTTYQEIEEIINSSDYHVILGYCFSRNDQALRFYTNTNPVTSYVDN
ncbi:hypothetical protein ACSLVK_20205 [Photorhabdus tasmaniensis]|uniref:hypothetical protein n=1 Tax=Photorhabdus tasmaniensis TaxID=1004159 RepID=UPI004042AB0E